MEEARKLDSEAVQAFASWGSAIVAEFVDYLVRICSDPDVFPDNKKVRIMLAALLLHERAAAIAKDRITDRRAVNAGKKARILIDVLTSAWWTSNSFSEAMLSESYLQEGLTIALNRNVEDLTPESLWELLRSFVDEQESPLQGARVP